jgi:subtilisin family serine protease
MAIIVVKVTQRGKPMTGAAVTLRIAHRDGGSAINCPYVLSGNGGLAACEYDDDLYEPERIIVDVLDYWTISVRCPAAFVEIELEPLPRRGPKGWWHEVLGIDPFDADRGCGIRVGVIDTGVNPHEALAHLRDLGTCEGMYHHPAKRGDSWGHGTHVCGIIGARPPQRRCYWGIAPGTELLSVRVTARKAPVDADTERRMQDSLAEAVEMLVLDEQVDLINISLGAHRRSINLGSRITEAFNRGVLCICAAGNDGREGVRFPAAYPESIAVTAIGHLGVGPGNNVEVPEERDKRADGQLFFARYSNFGPETACCAPGVRIISTAWGDPASYVEMSGTSMASPAACGVLASLLSTDLVYRAMDRDARRAAYARAVLDRACRSIGLDPKYQGRGLIQAR